MTLLNIKNGSKTIEDKVIFENINLEINGGDKIALFAENGVGKTTLIECIVGKKQLSTGSIYLGVAPHDIGYVCQKLTAEEEEMSVEKYLKGFHSDLSQLEEDLEQLRQQLTLEPENRAILEKYGEVEELYQLQGGYSIPSRITQALTQMRLPISILSIPMKVCSGGQKTRIQLAQVILRSPNLILLDEPTNHLDQQTILFLEEWLRGFNGTFMLVSHDRAFIDATCTKIIELSTKGITSYDGNYSSFKQQKELEWKTTEASYLKYQSEKKNMVRMIQQYKEWHQKANDSASVRNPYAQKQAAKQASKVKAKEKKLDQLDKQKVEKPQQTTYQFKMAGEKLDAKTVLRIVDLSFGHDHLLLGTKLSLTVGKRDRLMMIGPNGVGKTTLVQTILGNIPPLQGSVILNNRLRMASLSQELNDLKQEQSIIEQVVDTVEAIPEADARTLLNYFKFPKERIHHKVSQLSMGEKCRLAFVRLYFTGSILLVLDEPTNYLDIPTRERMEEVLDDYSGAILCVSHDRTFISNVGNRILDLNSSELRVFNGSYTEYVHHQHERGIAQDIKKDKLLLELKLNRLIQSEEALNEEKLGQIKELKMKLRTLE